ncbi:MAG: hypothetical protein M3Z75_05090 [Actinomycetota bacterium]|nr:hypothetical protein [Actinomycetota bacterium]
MLRWGASLPTSVPKMTAFAGVIAVGIILLVVALVLAVRRRRPIPVPAAQPPRHAAPF